MATKSIWQFFQGILDSRILRQIEPFIAKAQNLGLPEKDLNEALMNLEYYESKYRTKVT